MMRSATSLSSACVTCGYFLLSDNLLNGNTSGFFLPKKFFLPSTSMTRLFVLCTAVRMLQRARRREQAAGAVEPETPRWREDRALRQVQASETSVTSEGNDIPVFGVGGV